MINDTEHLTVQEVEKIAKELGVPTGFFNKVLGMANSAMSYWKTQNNGKIPAKYQTDIINAIVALKYVVNRTPLKPVNDKHNRPVYETMTLLKSALLLLQEREDDPMIKSSITLVESAIQTLKTKS